MSNIVDSKVVEMRFDNSNFEKNIAQSMQSLQNIEKQLDGMSKTKGLEALNESAKKVDFSSVEKGVDSVKVKLSSLQVAGATVVSELTKKFLNFGKTLKNNTFGQIESGGLTRALNLEQAQFQIEGLGKSWKKTKKDVLYGVKDTAYGLDEAARVSSQLLASQIKNGKEMKSALRGISGLAAMTNSSYGDIGNIYTKIAGNGRMMSQELLQLSARGMNAAAVLKDYANSNESVRKSMIATGLASKQKKNVEGFANATKLTEQDIRTLTTAGAIDFKTFSAAMDKAFGKHAAKANETYTGSLANLKAALSRVGADIQVPKLEALRKIFNALTKVIDKLHEKMQPLLDAIGKLFEKAGGRAVEIIKRIGKSLDGTSSIFEKAGGYVKKFSGIFDKNSVSFEQWQKLTKGGFVNKTFEKSLKRVAKASGINVDKMIKKNGSFAESLKKGWLTMDIFKKALNSYKDKTGKVAKGTSKLAKSTGMSLKELDKISNQVIRGNFGNGLARVKALTKAGYDYNTVQSLVNHKLIGTKFNFDKYGKSLDKLSDKQLKHQGYTKKEIKTLRSLSEEAKKTGTPLNKLMSDLSKPTGFEATINAISVALKSAKKIAVSFGQAFKEIFLDSKSQKKFSWADKMTKLADKIKMTDAKVDKFKRTFKGLFAAIDIVRILLSGPVRLVFTVIKKIFENFNISVLDATASIGDMIVAFRDWLKSDSAYAQAINFLADVLSKVVMLIGKLVSGVSKFVGKAFTEPAKGIKEFIKTIKKTGKVDFKPLSKGFSKFGSAISNVFSKAGAKVKEFLVSHNLVSGDVFDSITGKAKGLFGILKNIFGKIKGLFSNMFDSKKSKEITGTITTVKKKLNSGLVDKKELKKNSFALDGFLEKIKDVLSNFGKWISSFFENMDFYTVAGFGVIIALFAFLFGVLKSLAQLSGPIQKVVGVFESLGGAIAEFRKNLKVERMLKLAGVVALLAGSIWLLAQLPIEQLLAAAGVLVCLAVAMLILSKASGKVDLKGSEELIKVMLSLSASVLILSIALTKISKMVQAGTLWESIGALGVILASLTALLIAIGKLGKPIDAGAKQIIAISLSLLIIVFALKRLNDMEIDNVPALIGKMILCLGMLVAVFAATKLLGQHAKGAAASILLSSISLLLLVSVLKRLDNLELKDVFKTIGNMILAVGMLGLLMLETKILGQHAKGAGLTLISMAASLLILTFVIKRISELKPSEISRGLKTIAVLSLLMAGIIFVTAFAGKNARTVAAALLSFAAAMVILVALVAFIGGMDPSRLVKGLAVVTMLGILMVALIAVSSKAGNKTIIAQLIVLMLSFALLASMVRQLSELKPENVITATACIVALGAMMAVLIAISSKTGPQALIAVLGMVVLIAALGVAIYLLSSMPNVDKAVAIMAQLTPLLLALSVAMAICSVIPFAAAINGVASMAIFIAGLTAILVALGAIQQIPGLSWLVSEGGKLLVKIGSIIGSFVGSIVKGFVIKVSESLPVLGKNLSLFMTNLSGFIDGLKKVDDGAMKKAGELIAVIAFLLAESTWNDILAGIEHIMSIFGVDSDKLGFEGMANGMKTMGDALSSFANATSGLDIKSVEGTTDLLGKLVDSLSVLGDMDIGYEDIDMFIEGLKAFANSLTEILPIIKSASEGMSDDDLEGMKKVASILSSFTNAMDNIPNTGGFAQAFTGENDYTGFAEGLKKIAEVIKSVKESFKDLTDEDVTNVNHVITLVSGFTKALDDVPNTGGVAQWFTGEEDYSGFAKGIKKIASAVKSVKNSFKDLTDEDVTNVNHVIKLIKGFTKSLDNVPNTGGVAQWFTGEEDYSGFAKGIKKISGAIKSVKNSFKDLTDEDVSNVKHVIDLIKGFTKSLDNVPNTGGVSQWFTGEEDYSGFAKGVNKIGSAIASIKDKFADMTDEDFYKVESVVDMIGKLTKAADKIPDTGGLTEIFTGEEDYDGFAKGIKKLGNAVVSIGKIKVDESQLATADAIYNLVSKTLNMAKKMKSLASNLNSTSEEISVDNNAVTSIKTYLESIKTNLIDAKFGESKDSKKSGIDSFITKATAVSKKVNSLAKDLNKVDLSKTKDIVKSFNTLGSLSVDKFSNTIKNGKSKITQAVVSLLQTVKGAATAYKPFLYSSMSGAGAYAITGFCSGVSNQKVSAESTARAVMNAFIRAAKKTLDEHSPSKVFYKIGVFTLQGYINGVTKLRNKAIKSVTTTYDTIIKKAKDKLIAGGNILKPLIKNLYPNIKNYSLKNQKEIVKKVASQIQQANMYLYKKSGNYSGDQSSAKKVKKLKKDYNKDVKIIKKYKKFNDKLQHYEDKIEKTNDKKKLKKLRERKSKYQRNHKKVLNKYNKAVKDKKEKKKAIDTTEQTIQKNMQASWNELANTIKDNATSFLDPLKNAIDTGIDLFAKFENGQRISAGRMIANMKSQIKASSDWAADLNTLKARGLSETLLNKLREKGISGYQDVKSFLRMDAKQIAEANNLADQEIKISFKTMMDNLAARMGKAKSWKEKLKTLAKNGVDKDAIIEILKMGIDEALPYIDALSTANKSEIKEFNKQFKSAIDSDLSTEGMIAFVESINNTSGSSSSGGKNQKDSGKKKKSSGKKKTTKKKKSSGKKKTTKKKKSSGKKKTTKKKTTKKGKIKSSNKKVKSSLGENLGLDLNGDSANEVVENFVYSIADGIEASGEPAVEAASSLGTAIKDSLNYTLSIDTLGNNAIIQLINSLKDAKDISDSLTEIILTPLKEIEQTKNSIGEHPTITPILNLDKLEQDIEKLNSMFKNDFVIDVAANMSNGKSSVQNTKSGDIINNYNNKFTQNNYSPKALDADEIYRRTNNFINSKMKGGTPQNA